MKTYKLSLAAVLALGSLLACTNPGFAQSTNQVTKGTAGSDAARAERMAKMFDLTAQQQAKVQALFEDETGKTRALQADTTVPREQKREKIRAIHEEGDKKLKTIFTPEQWDKMLKEREAMHQVFIQKKAELDKKAAQKAP